MGWRDWTIIPTTPLMDNQEVTAESIGFGMVVDPMWTGECTGSTGDAFSLSQTGTSTLAYQS